MLRNGTEVPPFDLIDQKGRTFKSAECRGRITVIIFHRGAFCPTTDRFLTAYQDIYRRLQELQIVLIGVSADANEVQKELADRLKISFPMVSDPLLTLSKAFEVYEGEGKTTFVEPALFIVDAEGKICYSVITSGPKGLPEPGAILPVLLYMKSHNGLY